MTGAGVPGPRIALVLPGGGARSAWQVGVLNAIAGWFPKGAALPFPVVCGTSAGAINATVLASHADNFHRGAGELARVWAAFRVGQVFRTGTVDMLRSGLQLALALLSGGWLLPMPRALLDNGPLRTLLARNVDFERLRRTIVAGRPEALAISATSLTHARSVTFVETAQPFAGWDRAARCGVQASLRIDHLMASAAVPFLFPTVAMEGGHFSDGALRQTAPLAPAIHLGAERILIIGVRPHGGARPVVRPAPNMAEQFGFMLDALFMESMHADLERLNRINALLARSQPGPAPFGMRHVDALLLQPEDDPSDAALVHQEAMPGALRSFLRVLGARGARGGRLMSFLMFESAYTRALIAAGERDAGRRRAEISAFLGIGAAG